MLVVISVKMKNSECVCVLVYIHKKINQLVYAC